MKTRFNKRTHTMMRQVSLWIPIKEYEKIDRRKGDLSINLMIRRILKKSLSSGSKATNQTPEEAVVEAVEATTESPEAPRKEVEAS